MNAILAEFINKTEEDLDRVENLFISLKSDPYNQDTLTAISSILSIIHDSSRFHELEKLSEIAELVGNLIKRLKERKITAGEHVLNTILSAMLTIKQLIASIKSNLNEPEKKLTQTIANSINHIPLYQEIIDSHLTQSIQKDTSSSQPQSLTETAILTTHSQNTKTTYTSSTYVKEGILDSLLDDINDLVLTKKQLQQLSKNHPALAAIFQAPLQRLDQLTQKLHNDVSKTRMQPISSIWKQYAQLLIELNAELTKKIKLTSEGDDVELDQQVLELIKAPIASIIIYLGVCNFEGSNPEPAQIEYEANTIKLKASSDNSMAIIEISNSKARHNMKQSFDNYPEINNAKAVIEKIGGNIEFEYTEGKGSKCSIRVPLTLLIMQALIVESQNLKFAYPQARIHEILKITRTSPFEIGILNGSPIVKIRDNILPLISLAQELELEEINLDYINRDDYYIIVSKVGNYQYGIVVDTIYDIEEIIVKPLSPPLHNIKQYSGNTILGDDSIIMVINPSGLTVMADKSYFTSTSKAPFDIEPVNNPKTSKLLLFKSNDSIIRAIPLEVVSRIDALEFDKIELLAGKPVIQYCNQPMRLIAFENDYKIPHTGIRQVIIFTDGNRRIGLVVAKIQDIVTHEFTDSISTSSSPKILGQAIVDEKVIEIVNVSHFFNEIYGLEHHSLTKSETSAHVLLVDDSAFFRKFIPPAITSAGYKVTSVDNVSKAIEILELDHKISAVITDLNMPGKTGFDLATHIKNHPQLRFIPVLALSSHITDDLYKNSSNVGKFDAFIAKTHHSKLLEKLSELVA